MAPSASGFTSSLHVNTDGEGSDQVGVDIAGRQTKALKELRTLSRWFDDRFTVPGTNLKFGLDSLVGLIPGVGDTISAGISAAMILRARQLGIRKRTQLKMLSNIGIDWLVGTVPVVGDVFDFAYKANRKNVDLLERELLRGDV